jgi:hypothetical protein
MKLFRIFAPIGVSVVLALGLVVSFSTPAIAQTKQVCHMKGLWNANASDPWEFDAAYVYNKGEDDFTGVYSNPIRGTQANITGAARSGTWNILFTYTDAKSVGYTKRLVGTGALDPATHGILVRGSFQEFKPGSSAPVVTGTFAIDGQCH